MTCFEEVDVAVLVEGDVHEAAAQTVVGEHQEHALEHVMHLGQVLAGGATGGSLMFVLYWHVILTG